jgi:hypothetical protein
MKPVLLFLVTTFAISSAFAKSSIHFADSKTYVELTSPDRVEAIEVLGGGLQLSGSEGTCKLSAETIHKIGYKAAGDLQLALMSAGNSSDFWCVGSSEKKADGWVAMIGSERSSFVAR